MWSMKKMWRDRFFGVARLEYQVSRCFSNVARYKNQEPRSFKGGSECDINVMSKVNLRTKFHYSLLATCVIALGLFLGSCDSDVKKTADKQQYTCSMHPQIIENEPGNCPICGMTLTPIHGQHQTNESVDSLLATGKNKDAQAETIIIKESSNTPELSLDGTATYNTNQLKSISARVGGRVEKSYVKYNFEPIKKGQLLLKIYSPELVAIQQELLFLKAQNDLDLLNQTKSKLILLGVTAAQINSILKTGKADYTINIYSNYSGYLLNPETGNGISLQKPSNPLNIKEGQYINSGDLLFKVFNDNSLWTEFYTNTLESDWLKVGNKVNLKIGKKSIETRVNFIQPFFKDNQNYKVVRVVLNNQNHQYKIGELAKATIKHLPITGLWIPQQAVYQSGEKNLVYLKTPDGLEVKEVEISAKTSDQILVKKGLKEGDEIAVNASYLTDSESFINSK